MEKINVAFFYMLGQFTGRLFGTSLALTRKGYKQPFDYAEWIDFENASRCIDPNEIAKILPRTAIVARTLSTLVTPIATNPAKQNAGITHEQNLPIGQTIKTLDNVLESECRELFTYFVPDVGAYSTPKLVEQAESHLSKDARDILTKEEITDFQKAGECLAFGLYTASGFHSMRALESEARRYHMVAVGASSEVDWTLDPLINGNSGRAQFGLRDQWKKEGARDDNPLVLVMALLSTLNQIYRNPIMHPKMTLDFEQAKQVFNVSSIAINAMVADRITRGALSGGKSKP